MRRGWETLGRQAGTHPRLKRLGQRPVERGPNSQAGVHPNATRQGLLGEDGQTARRGLVKAPPRASEPSSLSTADQRCDVVAAHCSATESSR